MCILKHILLSVFLILSIISLVGATKQIICAYCDKPIESGEYIKIDGNYYHKNHFLCAYCGRPISDQRYYSVNGRYYDSSCYFNAVLPKCGYCNLPIEGPYVESGGGYYHKQCYDEHLALRCSLCGGIITGDYIIDDWGNKYHIEHENHDPQCRYCQRFLSATVSEGGETYADGRTVCGICLKSAVNDRDEAEDIISEVGKKMAASGITIDVDKIKLALVDSRQMAKINPDLDEMAQGLTRFEQMSAYFGLVKERRIKIYILDGLPLREFVATAAHELMHAWLYTNGPADMDKMLVEGSCNYAAWLALMDDDSPEAEHIRKRMIAEALPTYGEGFRKVKSWVENNDIPTWLEYLKNNTQVPW
jgi:hypothetical protein